MPKRKTERMEFVILEEILSELRFIRRMLEPRFTLHIHQKLFYDVYSKTGAYWHTYATLGDSKMAAITAGQSASFFLSATASDNSTPVLADQTLTADDASVQIAPDSSDSTGNTFTVTVPASDTQTSFNLSASASVTSNTSSTAQTITATLSATISPATQPVTFTLTINEK